MLHQVAGASDGNINSFNLVGQQGMGWSMCEDGVEGYVGGQLGYGGAVVWRPSDQGTAGIPVMAGVDLMYLETDRR